MSRLWAHWLQLIFGGLQAQISHAMRGIAKKNRQAECKTYSFMEVVHCNSGSLELIGEGWCPVRSRHLRGPIFAPLEKAKRHFWNPTVVHPCAEAQRGYWMLYLYLLILDQPLSSTINICQEECQLQWIKAMFINVVSGTI